MSRPVVIEHRRGATFSYVGTAKLPAGTWSAACSLEQSDGTPVAALEVTLEPLVTPTPEGHTHALALEKDAVATAAWPLEDLGGDILFTDGDGFKLPSVIFTVRVFRGKTGDA